MNQHGFFIDLSRCTGCNSCTVSCKQWHDIPPGPAKPMRVYQWETGVFPEIELRMLPIMCYHCENPVCVEACPNKAIHKEEKYGAVLVDPDKCQGTRKCWIACPYGAPQYESDEPGTKMLKCDMCIDRLEEGLKPICVLSCSMRALEFGPLDEIVKKYGSLRRLNAKPGNSPCLLACPAQVNAEGYIALVAEGKVKKALNLFRETTPLAGVLGRVCTHPCEAECQRGKIDEPIAIRSLKRYMADCELKGRAEKVIPFEKTKEKRVAIVGSGPTGLSCAYNLNRKGYPVTVFEAASQIGGMLKYCIPEYRLPKEILGKEIVYIEESGVEIRTDTPVKKLEEIFKSGYRAIFIATGAWISQKIGIHGEDARGVTYALDFLKRANSGENNRLGLNKVAVIGGGSVAIDSARLALRLGAKEVHLVCLESKDLTCRDRMLAQDLEIKDAEEEGVIIHPCLGIKRILIEDERVVGLETAICTSVLDAEGKFAPKLVEGPAPTIVADTIIVAIGQRPDSREFSEVEKSESGSIKVDELTLGTNIKGVFAGGDVVTGPADVVNAIAAGRQAAISIDRYLSGLELGQDRLPFFKSKIVMGGIKSIRPPVTPVKERKGYAEVELSLDQKTASEQANRCFHCGSTMPCMVFKPRDSKTKVIPWDATKALELWQKRQPFEGEPLPDIFDELSDVTEVPMDIVGRNRLVLKAKNSEELIYYTTDNE